MEKRIENDEVKIKPEDSTYWSDIRCASEQNQGTQGGILKVCDGGEPLDRWKTIQDAHNANHVLTHFSFMIYRILSNRTKCNFVETKDRIIAHLACLREFVRQDEIEVLKAIYTILYRIQKSSLLNLQEWARFMLTNWEDIRVLAGRYSQPDRCFSDDDFISLSKFVSKS